MAPEDSKDTKRPCPGEEAEARENTTVDASSVCIPDLLNCGSSLTQRSEVPRTARRRRPDAAALAPQCLRHRGRTSSPARAHKGRKNQAGGGDGRLHGFTHLPDPGPASSKTRGPLGHITGRGQACPSSQQAYGPLIMHDPKPGRTPAKALPPTSPVATAMHNTPGVWFQRNPPMEGPTRIRRSTPQTRLALAFLPKACTGGTHALW